MNLKNGMRFKFADPTKDIGQHYVIVDITKPGDDYIIHYRPEITPVANSSMFRYGAIEIVLTARDHSGCLRGFHRSSKAWYAKVVDGIEISFGMYHPDGSSSGEMTMAWRQVGNSPEISAQLRAWNGSWSALSLFPDLIQKMGEVDNQNIQEHDFVLMLESCGFTDLTEYKNPHIKPQE